MNNNTKRRRLTALLAAGGVTCGVLAATIPTVPALGALTTRSASSAENFKDPDLDSKIMARMWFPDAGAGATPEGLAQIDEQIRTLAAGGYGGVEIAYLADSASYTNTQAKDIGFGSKNWQNVLKQVLRTANSIPGGFKIDITITSHWPPAVNSIDPNDAAQQKETSQAYRKITADDLAAGTAAVPLPTQKKRDFSNTSSLIADFLFVDDFSSAAVARVKSVNASGVPVLEYASLADVTGATQKDRVTSSEIASGATYKTVGGVDYAGYAAGIPDAAYAAANGINYQTGVVDKFGPDPVDPDFSGKIDADGNRKRMADWQYKYETDLDGIPALDGYTPSAGSDLAVGDYVIIGNYYRGTGQIMSGGEAVTQYNRTYATDYFDGEGAQKIFDFWDDHILDPELKSLLEQNAQYGSSIFEDSIEVHKDTAIWTHDFPQEFADFTGRDIGKDASVLATTSTTLFDDTTAVTRAREDYNQVLGNLYETEHADLIHDWAADFGYTYRAQAYTLPGLDVAAAASAVDIAEGDNSTAGDGLRTLSGAVNLNGDKFLSMESFTDGNTTYSSNWLRVMKANNKYYASGVNRSLLHGMPFTQSFNDYQSAWPGWTFRSTYSAFAPRQAYWQDVDQFFGYLSRTQEILQTGTAKVDFAVLQGTEDSFGLKSGNSLQQLLNRGYSYNFVSAPLLKLPSATVTDGVLAKDGPAYKALIIKDAANLDVATLNKVIAYADAGLPVILMDSDLSRVYGTSTGSNTDTALATAVATLKAKDNVAIANSQAELRVLLNGFGVTPTASYNTSGLTVLERQADEGSYYFFYNGNEGTSATSVPRVTAGPITSTVTLRGTGTPYLLDAVTGEVSPVTTYTQDGDSTTFDISVQEQGAVIVGMIDDTAAFPDALGVHATDSGDGTVVETDDGGLELVASAAGTHQVAMSDGTTRTVDVAAPEATVDLSSSPWDLTISSFGPDAANNAADPTKSVTTDVSFTDVPLGAWSTLSATSDQLSQLGVANMAQVSGIGTYSTTLTLPDSWTASDGAKLKLTHGWDMVTGVKVNGTELPNVSQWTDTADLGHYLKAGANTLEVTVDTTLNNRYLKEQAKSGTQQAYGLTAAVLTPYSTADLAAPAVAPVNTTAPSISGTVKAGNTVTCSSGEWTGADSYSYAWLLDGDQVGTGQTLALTNAQAGGSLVCQVTATGETTATASSEAVTVAGPVPAVNTVAPSIAGDARSGNGVSCATGTWTGASSFSYAWYADDELVGDEQTLSITQDMVGASLTCRVTGSGDTTTTASSAAVTVKAQAVLVNSVAPSIVGVVRVGTAVTCDPGEWDGADRFTFAWKVNGSVVSTASTYTPTARQAGATIACQVTATGEAGTARSTTAVVKVQLGAAPVAITRPSISGKTVVGKRVTAKPGTWSIKGATFHYQWYVGGKAVKGATGRTLKLTKAFRGKQVHVKVTANVSGYAAGVATSANAKVRK